MIAAALAAQAENRYMRDEMSILFRKVGYTKESHPSLLAANQISSLEALLAYTLSELVELKEEHEKLSASSDKAHKPLQPSKSWWLEFADFIVMLKIINEKTGHKFFMHEANFSVNGQFKGNFDSLEEQTVNLGEGDVFRNFELLFTELMSLIKHTGADLQGNFFARLINTKLFLNRESRFFKAEPNMNEVDIIDKNNHVFKALRLLRNFILEATGAEGALQPWVTDFFAEEILDWRNSSVALEKIKQKIAVFKIKIKDELAWSLTAGLGSDPFLEMKMMIAGAKMVGVKENANLLTLQSRSSNATLAGTTVFWT